MRRLFVLGLGFVFALSGAALGGSLAESVHAEAATACPKRPFSGTVSRRASTSQQSQPAAERRGSKMRSALVYDFGTRKNYTIYLGDYVIDEADLGSTLTAPSGRVLVTMFLRAEDRQDLRDGQKLEVGKDPVTVIVDAGGGARARTTNPRGTVEILSLGASKLCYRIDYRDDEQQVKGTVSAKIP